MPAAEVVLTLNAQNVPTQVQAAANAYRTLATEEQKAAQEAQKAANAQLQLVQARARLASATGDQSRALSVLNAGLAQHTGASERATLAVQTQAARLQSASTYAEQFGSSIGQSITAMIGPAALATAAIGGLMRAIQAAEEAYKFKAALDQTNASISVLLGSVRGSAQIFSQASRFSEQYKFTQQETSEAILASSQVIRGSKAPIDEILATLSRLRVLNPAEDFAGAARAVAELNAGQIVSIVNRFNISRVAANKMKEEIRGGADAMQVLSRYLDSAGVGMDALAIRTEGAAGKMNQLKVENEQFQLALAGQAGGVGGFILDRRIELTRNATKALSGDAKTLGTDMNALFSAVNPIAGMWTIVAGSTDLATQKMNEMTGTSIPPLMSGITGLYTEWARWLGIVEKSPGSVPNSDRLKDDLIGIAQAAGAAADAMAGLQNRQNLPATLGIGRTNIRGGAGGPAGLFGAGAMADADRFFGEVNQLQQSRDQLALARATTSAQRLAIYRQQLSRATTEIEKNQILGRIATEQQAAAAAAERAGKARIRDANQALSLEERIRDSKEKQYKAQLDAAELAIRDRQDRRKEDQEIRAAQRILASGRASEAVKAAAADKLALIDVERRKRALAISEAQTTAGAQVINGRIIQARPGTPGAPPAGLPPLVPPAALPAALPPGPGVPAPPAAAAAGVEVAVYLDSEPIAARVIQRMRTGMRQSNAAGGGRVGA